MTDKHDTRITGYESKERRRFALHRLVKQGLTGKCEHPSKDKVCDPNILMMKRTGNRLHLPQTRAMVSLMQW